MTDNSISQVKRSVLLESCEDYVGLGAIAWQFREIHKEQNPQEVYRKTMQVIKELLSEGLIQAGMFPVIGDFEIWNLQTTEILNRIKHEWEALAREPHVGEIVWFIATEKGENDASLLK
jgi:hypothetical protein